MSSILDVAEGAALGLIVAGIAASFAPWYVPALAGVVIAAVVIFARRSAPRASKERGGR